MAKAAVMIDGVHFTKLPSTKVSMANASYIGMAVTLKDLAALNSVNFRNVSVSQTSTLSFQAATEAAAQPYATSNKKRASAIALLS